MYCTCTSSPLFSFKSPNYSLFMLSAQAVQLFQKLCRHNRLTPTYIRIHSLPPLSHLHYCCACWIISMSCQSLPHSRLQAFMPPAVWESTCSSRNSTPALSHGTQVQPDRVTVSLSPPFPRLPLLSPLPKALVFSLHIFRMIFPLFLCTLLYRVRLFNKQKVAGHLAYSTQVSDSLTNSTQSNIHEGRYKINQSINQSINNKSKSIAINKLVYVLDVRHPKHTVVKHWPH